jgi:thiol-disulfide isomerase/thioredoxin
LSFKISSHNALSSSQVEMLRYPLSSEDLTSGKPMEVRLPRGSYTLKVDCYNSDAKLLGGVEREMVVAQAHLPLELPALRIESTEHQKVVGKRAPEIEATDRDTGKPAGLAEFRGKVVILDFWGYWCGPCNAAMPHLAELHRKFQGMPVAVVALHDQSITSRAEYDRRTAFAKSRFWNGQDLPFRILLDQPDPDDNLARHPEGSGATCKKYQIRGFPTLFVIDQQGTIIATSPPLEHDRMETLVRALLEKSSNRQPASQ